MMQAVSRDRDQGQAPWGLSLISVPLASTDLLLLMNPG